jgi:branched-chain amino acid transport system ATP-binding protein
MHDMIPTQPTPALLKVTDLHVAYGKAEVVHGASFTVPAGKLVVLLGRNGAGKSTMLHAISSLIPKKGGRIEFDGQDITTSGPIEIVRAGVVQVLQGHRVFHSLSVEDNLLIGTFARNPRGDRTKLDRVYTLFPELKEKRHQAASRLSGGQQQILAVGQGIVGDPRLLILGLAPIIINRILDVAVELCREGMSILLVEQLVEKALQHADHCFLVETGRIAWGGTPEELRSGDMLHRVYLGGG